jgi:serine/threonine-protein kinase RsbW
MTPERRFPKSLSSLEDVFTFLQESLSPTVTDGHIVQVLSFGAEEFFTNCVKYNGKSANDILVRIHRTPASVSVQIIDDDVDPFDVTAVPPPDLEAPIESRRPGRLGIHLSRELLDDLAYEYAGTTSTITMTMNIKD